LPNCHCPQNQEEGLENEKPNIKTPKYGSHQDKYMVADDKSGASMKASDVLSRIKDKRTLTERILLAFPGYRGYKEKELMRETDKLIRNAVFRNMKEAAEAIRTIYGKTLNDFGLSSEVRQLERLSIKSDALAEKIRHATHGYSPLMNVLKVDEEALMRLMEFDAGLADDINELMDNIKSVEKEMCNSKVVPEGIGKIEHALGVLVETFDKRNEALSGLSGE
jgi:hypothetical protein